MSLEEALQSNFLVNVSLATPPPQVRVAFDPRRTFFRLIGNWAYTDNKKVIVARRATSQPTPDVAQFGSNEMYPMAIRFMRDNTLLAVEVEPVDETDDSLITSGLGLGGNYCYAFEILMLGATPQAFKVGSGGIVEVATSYKGDGAFTCAYDEGFKEGIPYEGSFAGLTKNAKVNLNGVKTEVFLRASLSKLNPILSSTANNWWFGVWVLKIDLINRENLEIVAPILRSKVMAGLTPQEEAGGVETTLEKELINTSQYDFNNPIQAAGDPTLGGAISDIQIWGIEKEKEINEIFFNNPNDTSEVAPTSFGTAIRKAIVTDLMFSYDHFLDHYWHYRETEETNA